MNTKKYSYLAKNTLLFTISSVGSKLLAFILVPFYTSILSKSDYGTADLVTTSSNLLIFIVTICISDAVLRFAIDSNNSKEGVFRYGLQVLLKGSTIFGSILTIVALINPFHCEKYLYLFLFLTVCSNTLYQIVSNYLRAIDKVGSVAIMGLLTTVFTISSNIVCLVILKIGVLGYLISFVLGFLFSSFYGLSIIYKYDREAFSQKCSKETKSSMIRYSLPLVPNGLAWWMNSSLDRYFIIFFCGLSINGLYAVASKIPTILNVINQIFHQAWNLSAIKEYDKEDNDGFFRTMYSLYNFVLIISCSFLVIINVFLAKLLFSKDFFVAWEYSSILLASAVFSSLSGFIGSIFVAVKNSKIFAVSTIIAAIVNIILNLLFIPLFGAIGAAVATAISFFTIWLIRFICATKYIQLTNKLFRDCISYALIIIQIIFEHFNSHYYFLQILIFLILLFIYREELQKIIIASKSLARRVFSQ